MKQNESVCTGTVKVGKLIRVVTNYYGMARVFKKTDFEVLLLENAAGHQLETTHPNTKVMFLPPKTTNLL